MNAAQAALNEAARQAWVALWKNCMQEVGAQSLLTCDDAPIAAALNGYIAPLPEAVPALSELAQRLEGDGRIADITIRDVLVGLEDYFSLFRKMRRMHPDAYDYFSRVGSPLCLEASAVSRSAVLEPKPIVDAKDLPAFIGVFFTDTPENVRDEIINDKPSMLDFHLYEKRRRNIAVSVPPTWTIYDHSVFSLERDIFTKAERKRYRLARSPWNYHYFIGIDPSGVVHALPMWMNRPQHLKNGGTIHHNRFVIPPGLFTMADHGKHRTVHDYAAFMFAVVRNFCAASLSGAQLSVRRGDEVARFGIPLSNLKGFFRDRDREGRRRKALLHYVGEYSYERQGRSVTVGEHLRGARRFSWRDYDITVSAPGIHAPMPESLSAEPMMDDDILPVQRIGIMTVDKVGEMMQRKIERAASVPFRRGKPTVRYRVPHLEEGRMSMGTAQ